MIDQHVPRIYLDTNHWIRLLRISQHLEENQALEKVFHAIKKLTVSNKIRVLYSAFTLEEIWKYHDTKKQNDLIDLVLDISQQWVLKPHVLFKRKEIENAANFILNGKYVHDINAEIVGRGLCAIFDNSFDHMNEQNPLKWELLKNNPWGLSEGFFRENFQRYCEDLENTKQILRDERLRAFSKKVFEESKQEIDGMEGLRQKHSGMGKGLFARYSTARFLVDDVIPDLAQFMVRNQVTPEQLFGKCATQTAKDRMDLFNKHLNSLNVMRVLVSARDLIAQKEITINDASDIAHLSGAIPYCDIVVTDKMAASICRRERLDRMYDCVVLDKLEDLSHIELIKSQISQ